MVNIAANMTQVITNSPQVSALLGGEAAAAEQIKRMNQAETSRRVEERTRSTVVAAEKSAKTEESEEEIRQRIEGRNRRLMVSERREGRPRSRRAAPGRAERAAEADSPAGATAFPFESQPVIDRSV